jgi:hypothetical protein
MTNGRLVSMKNKQAKECKMAMEKDDSRNAMEN